MKEERVSRIEANSQGGHGRAGSIVLVVVAALLLGLAMAGPARADVQWVRQSGTALGDIAFAVAATEDGVYTAGYTADSAQAFVQKHSPEGAPLWSRVIDSSSFDEARGLAADGTGVYVGGFVMGTIDGQVNGGDCSSTARCTDAFLMKFGTEGQHLWTRQFGSPETDEAYAVAMDSTGVYVAGESLGVMPGTVSGKAFDAFIRKYSSDGEVLWTVQFGGASFDRVHGIASDGTSLFAAGLTGNPPPDPPDCCDAFLRKLTISGNEVWSQQFGTEGEDSASSVAVDATGVYVAGGTDDSPPGLNRWRGDHGAFVRKFSHDGEDLWLDRYGTPRFDAASGVAVGSLGVYVGGVTCLVLPGEGRNFEGDCDAYVRRYSFDGSLVGSIQFGTSKLDVGRAVSVEGFGLYLAGSTDGSFPGESSAGAHDVFVARLDGRFSR